MKVVLIFLLFVNGEGQGIYQPIPVFETMEECVTAAGYLRQGMSEAKIEAGNVTAICVSDKEVKVVE